MFFHCSLVTTVGIMRDYVQRVRKMLSKLSQEQLARLFDSIVKENEMFDSILESITTGLVVVDREWKVLKVNKMAERYLSFVYYVDESKSESMKIWEYISEGQISDFLQNCAKNDKTNVSEEFTTTDSAGKARFLLVTVFSLINRSEICGNIIKVYDITEKRQQEIKLRRMENMAGLTNLAAGMAHEIKNPLGAISIHIQLIQKAIQKKRNADGKLPEKKFLEDHLDIVNDEIESLNRLVMNFLLAVRPIKADLRLSNPFPILKNIVDFFSPEFNKADVSLALSEKHLSGKDHFPRILIDEKLFREAIINLIQNAFYAIKERYEKNGTKDGGGILIEVSEKYDKIIIAISDNGTGMTDETLSHIFEPYYTTKATGTGLGMTMVYKIVKEFSGEIQVLSEYGKGTTFTITIPLPQTDMKLIGEN